MGVGNAGGSTAYVLRTGQPARIGPEAHAALEARGEIQSVGVVGLGDWLGAPLVAEGRTLGVIAVQTYSKDERYTDDDVELLAYVGQHIGSALSRARAIEETRQRNAELALVNDIGLALAEQLDYEAIIELVGERIRSIFDVHSIFIALHDPATDMISWPYDLDEGERFHRDPRELGPGLTSRVITTQHSIRIGTQSEQASAGAVQVGGTDTQSWLGVPIPGAKRVVGVVGMEAVREHAFSSADERLLVTLASSMGVALENARLFEETKRLLAEADERAAELSIINGIQAGLAMQLEIQSMYDLVGDKIQEIFDAQVVDIGFLDREANLIRFPYSIERGVRFPDEPMPVIGPRRYVLESRQPLLLNDHVLERTTELGQTGVLQGEQPKSTLWAPLVIGDEATGVISLQNLDREGAFSDGDVRLLSTLAASLSVALDNARLIHETRQRVAELDTVNRLSQAIASELDLGALIELVGEQMRETFQADIVYVALHDRSRDLIEFPYFNEGGEREPPLALPLGQGLTSQIITSGEPMLLNQAAQFSATATPAIGTQALSYLGVPIRIGSATIGVISVQSTTTEGRFGDADVRLLTTIAANVGAAIRNARLYRETERRADEMAVLADVGREISSTLDPTVVLDRIVEQSIELLAAETSAVYLAEDDGRTFRAIVARGRIAEEILADRLQIGDGIIGTLMHDRQPGLINDTIADPRGVTIPGTDDDHNERMMVAPLIAHDQVIGAMVVWRPIPSELFFESDLALLVGLSQHAAIGIDNARSLCGGPSGARVGEDADRAKSTFLAAMSHEIPDPDECDHRNERPDAGYAPHRRTARLRRNDPNVGRCAAAIIDDILDFSKIEAGKVELEARPFALGSCIEGAIDVLAPAAAAKGIELVYRSPNGLPRTILGDQGRLRQVVLDAVQRGQVHGPRRGRTQRHGRAPRRPRRTTADGRFRSTFATPGSASRPTG